MSEPVGVALIGIGGYGRSHLESIRACRELGLCTFEAVTVRPQDAEPEYEKQLESEGVTIYRDAVKMFAEESSRVSLIAIPTGISSHRALSVAALDAGYYVVCEKPAAGAMDDVSAMKQASSRAGRFLAIGFQYLFSQSTQALKAAKLDGRWGRLLSAKGIGLWPRTSAYYQRNEWAGMIESGGMKIYDSPVQNAVSHYLQLMLYIAGDTAQSAARARTLYGENYRAKSIQSADTQFLRIDTDTKVRIEFWCSHSVVENHDIKLIFEFEHGTVEFIGAGASNGFFIAGKQSRERFGPEEPSAEIRRRVFENCIEAIATGSAPISTIDNAANHTEIVETLFTRSAPVSIVDESYIDVLNTDGGEGPSGENRVIRGLDELALSCFNRSESFAESGIDWGREGTVVEVS